MSFALHEVKSIARDVVREYQPEFEVIAVTPAQGGDSAELIVAPGGVIGAGLVSIHVIRSGSDQDLRWSIAEGLVRHFGAAQVPQRSGAARPLVRRPPVLRDEDRQ